MFCFVALPLILPLPLSDRPAQDPPTAEATQAAEVRAWILTTMAEVGLLMEQEAWGDAHDQLYTLLERHRGEPALIARLPEVERAVSRCEFELAGGWTGLDIGASFAGEQLRWDPAKRALGLRFAGDLEALQRSDDALLMPEGLGVPELLVVEGDTYGEHGPVRIELLDAKGAAYQIDLGVDLGGAVGAISSLWERDGSGWTSLDQDKKIRLAKGGAFHIELALRGRSLSVKSGSKRLLSGKIDAADVRQLRLTGFGGELAVEWHGKVEEEVLAMHARRQRSALAEAYRATSEDTLPDWAHAAMQVLEPTGEADGIPGLDPADPSLRSYHNEILKTVADVAHGLRYVELLYWLSDWHEGTEGLTPMREYYMAAAALELGLPEAALEHALTSAEASDYHEAALLLLVETALHEGNDERALEALLQGQTARPADGGRWLDGLRLLLRQADPETIEQYFATATGFPAVAAAVERGRMLHEQMGGLPTGWDAAPSFQSATLRLWTDAGQDHAERIGRRLDADFKALGELLPWAQPREPLRVVVFRDAPARDLWLAPMVDQPGVADWCQEWRAAVAVAGAPDAELDAALRQACIDGLLWQLFPAPPLVLSLGLPELLADGEIIKDLPADRDHSAANWRRYRETDRSVPMPEAWIATSLRWVPADEIADLTAKCWVICRMSTRKDSAYAEFGKLMCGKVSDGKSLASAFLEAVDEVDATDLWKELGREVGEG